MSVSRPLADVSGVTEAELIEQAIARGPALVPASWHIRLAEIRLPQGRLGDAARAYQAAISVEPGNKIAWSGLARARHHLGDIRGAIDAWQNALVQGSDSWEVRNDLGVAWMELREWDRAQACFARASSISPTAPVVLVNQATLAARRGSLGRAISLFEACVAANPSYARAHAGLGFALRDKGNLERAAVALQMATDLAPDDPTYTCGLGQVYLEAGAPDRASSFARAFLTRRPGYSGAIALESLARVALADSAAVARLFDYSGLVCRGHLPTPEGFANLAAFNSALTAHVIYHPTLMFAPASHATAQGLHSGSLLVEPRGPVRFLEQAIAAAVTEYGRRLSGAPEHPFLAHRPPAVYLKMWGVVLERGGHQTPHIHPAAWLSGVYYPNVPSAVSAGRGPAGCLEFGRPEREFLSKLPKSKWPIHRVRPEEGLLLLFPSYLYHRTIPFDAGTRVSVAFDVVPL